MRIYKFTLKAQEAVHEGQALARRANHGSYELEHLLKAQLDQQDGVVVPMLQKIGVDVRLLTQRVDEALGRFSQIDRSRRLRFHEFYLPRFASSSPMASDLCQRLSD